MAKPDRHLRHAANAAQRSQSKFRMGAILVSGSRVVAVGFNKQKTHTSCDTPYQTIHAELDVLRVARNLRLDTTGLDMYILRAGDDGTIRMARPCRACQQAIERAHLAHVYYTDEQGVLVALDMNTTTE